MAVTPDRTATLDQLLEVVVLLSADMRQSLAADGLTESRVHLLWVLRETGPATQRVIADALGVSARNVTGLVDALVETGFVSREPHPSDRRAFLVTLTEHGAGIVGEMERGHRELAGQLFGELGPRQFSSFSTGLTHVLERLRELVAEQPGGAA